MADKSLCANCSHWREEHYNDQGAFQGQLFGCAEYQGVEPDDERAQRKPEEVRASRLAIQKLRATKAQSFYEEATKPA